jgi:hypothetical protein
MVETPHLWATRNLCDVPKGTTLLVYFAKKLTLFVVQFIRGRSLSFEFLFYLVDTIFQIWVCIKKSCTRFIIINRTLF